MESYLVEFLVLERSRASSVADEGSPWTRDLAVADDQGALKVHVQTSRPDLALTAGVECGRLREVLVEPDVATHAHA